MGHSGWEDHVHSDQFHYVHHARFECNYGAASVPLDKFFGTFGESLPASSGAEVEKHGHQDLGALKYTREMFLYLILSLPLLAAPACAAVNIAPFDMQPEYTATLVSHGPIALAAVLFAFGDETRSMRWPFDKEKVAGAFGLHILIGWLVTILPVFHLASWVLQPVNAL